MPTITEENKYGECDGPDGECPITLQRMDETPAQDLVKMSDGRCYVASALRTYFVGEMNKNRTAGVDMILPTRSPFLQSDVDILYPMGVPQTAPVQELRNITEFLHNMITPTDLLNFDPDARAGYIGFLREDNDQLGLLYDDNGFITNSDTLLVTDAALNIPQYGVPLRQAITIGTDRGIWNFNFNQFLAPAPQGQGQGQGQGNSSGRVTRSQSRRGGERQRRIRNTRIRNTRTRNTRRTTAVRPRRRRTNRRRRY